MLLTENPLRNTHLKLCEAVGARPKLQLMWLAMVEVTLHFKGETNLSCSMRECESVEAENQQALGKCQSVRLSVDLRGDFRKTRGEVEVLQSQKGMNPADDLKRNFSRRFVRDLSETLAKALAQGLRILGGQSDAAFHIE